MAIEVSLYNNSQPLFFSSSCQNILCLSALSQSGSTIIAGALEVSVVSTARIKVGGGGGGKGHSTSLCGMDLVVFS